jgi:hypothetical protein
MVSTASPPSKITISETMPLRTDGDQHRGPAYVAGTVARKG